MKLTIKHTALIIFIVFTVLLSNACTPEGYIKETKDYTLSSLILTRDVFLVMSYGPVEIEITDLETGKKISSVEVKDAIVVEKYTTSRRGKKIHQKIRMFKDGKTFTKDEILNSSFIMGDFNFDKNLEKFLRVPVDNKPHKYSIRVFPEDGADPDDYFKVEVWRAFKRDAIIQNSKIKDINPEPYSLEMPAVPLREASSTPFSSQRGADVFGVLALGSIEIEVTDLDSGKKISTKKEKGDKYINEITNSSFIIGDFNNDAKLDKSIKILVGKETRRFHVRIFPEEGADPEEYFRVKLLLKDDYKQLVKDRKIRDINLEPYYFELKNLPPYIISSASIHANVGKEYVYDIVAKDPEGGALTFQAENLPEGAVFGLDKSNRITRTLTWTPTLDQLGYYQITLTVSDPEGTAKSEVINLSVVLPRPVIVKHSFSSSGVYLEWEAIPGAVGYNVYRYDRGLLSPIARVKKNYYNDRSATFASKYSYAIQAVDSLGREGSQSKFVYIRR